VLLDLQEILCPGQCLQIGRRSLLPGAVGTLRSAPERLLLLLLEQHRVLSWTQAKTCDSSLPSAGVSRGPHATAMARSCQPPGRGAKNEIVELPKPAGCESVKRQSSRARKERPRS